MARRRSFGVGVALKIFCFFSVWVHWAQWRRFGGLTTRLRVGSRAGFGWKDGIHGLVFHWRSVNDMLVS